MSTRHTLRRAACRRSGKGLPLALDNMLLRHAARVFPPSREHWADAMAAELAHIPYDAAALKWAAGCVVAMLLSQSTLAKLLGVTEQTVHRWETGKADIAKPAEALVRSLYLEQLSGAGKVSVRQALEKVADLEHAIDGLSMKIEKKSNKDWHLRLVA